MAAMGVIKGHTHKFYTTDTAWLENSAQAFQAKFATSWGVAPSF